MTFTINGKNIYQIDSNSEKKYIHQLTSFQFLCKEIIPPLYLYLKTFGGLLCTFSFCDESPSHNRGCQ